MPTWTTYKGLTVPSSTTGDAGGYLLSDLEALADRVGPCNFTATSNPTVSNDAGQGYQIGSFWVNTLTNTWFVCTNNTTGAAVWETFQIVPSATTWTAVGTLSINSINFVDTSGGSFTLTLPNPSSAGVTSIVVKDSTGSFGSNPLTIARHGSEKIEGLAASYVYSAAWGSLTLVTNGTDWFFV